MIDIPSFVRYVAMDANGDWYGYEVEPVAGKNGLWVVLDGRTYWILKEECPVRSWRDSCRAWPRVQ